MEKLKIEKIDIDVYSETLDNNLKVFVAPNKNFNNIYVTFSTKYGSVIREFIPIGKDKMEKVPDGVAHFLEHKVFEQEDGMDPFTFFTSHGIDANAYTTTDKTTYLFKGSNDFKEVLNYLLDYVQSPYFTDSNVDKEKGIIDQEISMYKDDPYTQLYEKVIYNSFINDPIKYPIIGTSESINSITKEDLYTCYNTFYHPSNMFLVITGNVDYKEVFKIVKENQKKKHFEKEKEIKVKTYDEPDNVEKEKEILKYPVAIPKIAISYKINIKKFKNIDIRKLKLYLNLFFEIKFGYTSTFFEKVKNKNILNNPIAIDYIETKSHLLFMILAEANNYNELIEEVNKELEDISISEEELERKKKALISSLVFMADDIESINNKIMSNIIEYDKVLTDSYSYIKNLNIKEFNKVLKNLNYTNSIYIIEN